MNYILYFLITIGATTAGSLTGMGGGVIIKPLMDVLGDFDVTTIGVISSITVFSMSLVSIGRQVVSKTKIPYKLAIPLAVGSVFGGYFGDLILSKAVSFFNAGAKIKVIQNSVLAVLILFVFLYMKNKDKIKGFHIKNPVSVIIVGCFLGLCSSFLGIGGGPINVALIILLMSADTKSATICSLMTILFAQISKLGTIALTTGFGEFNLNIVPVMVIAAISGGYIGATLNKKLSVKSVEKSFNTIQLVVLGITIFNIIRNI